MNGQLAQYKKDNGISPVYSPVSSITHNSTGTSQNGCEDTDWTDSSRHHFAKIAHPGNFSCHGAIVSHAV